MKKLNIIVLLSTIIMFCLLFVAACSSETIAAPRNLEIIEGTSVSWDKVDGAVRYTVNIDGKEYYTADTSYPLSQLTVPAVYQIKIKASSAIGNVSLFSDTVKHYVGTPGLIYLDRYASIGVSELGTADTSETVIIAAFWQGRQVEWIWSEAFYNCISLKSIIIPESITVIYPNAFVGSGIWNSAESVVYADKWVVGYKNGTMGSSVSLKSDTVGISSYAFSNCIELKNINISSSVSYVGNFAFNNTGIWNAAADGVVCADKWVVGCKGKLNNEIKLKPDTVGICTAAFSGAGITNIELPDSLEIINESAFYFTEIKSIIIPKKVKMIGLDPFFSLESIKVSPDNTVYKSDGDCIIRIADNKVIAGCKNSIIPAYVKSIGDMAFGSAHYSLENKPTIPQGVVSIGRLAFACNYSFDDIIIPNSVKNIGYGAFASTSIKSIIIPESITKINDRVFSSCASLKSITIPSSVTSIGNSAFENCTSLENINIPNSVESIGYSAFYNCSSLKNIVLPNRIKNIENCTFQECSSLENINIPNSVENIGESAFYKCTSLKSIIFSNKITIIKAAAFGKCTSLENVVIPDSVTTIENGAFQECDSLESIIILGCVTSVGSHTFIYCPNLTIYVRGPESLSNNWTFDWNPDKRPVVWDYSGN